jgi:hypothetical protein
MDHFVARENFKCLTTRLKSNLHQNTRSHLQKLLLEEESKLGADLEFLAEIDKTISNFEALIETQEKFVTIFNGNDGREMYTLRGLRKTRDLYQMYRKKIIAASGRMVP